jgi:hypothetical protein
MNVDEEYFELNEEQFRQRNVRIGDVLKIYNCINLDKNETEFLYRIDLVKEGDIIHYRETDSYENQIIGTVDVVDFDKGGVQTKEVSEFIDAVRIVRSVKPPKKNDKKDKQDPLIGKEVMVVNSSDAGQVWRVQERVGEFLADANWMRDHNTEAKDKKILLGDAFPIYSLSKDNDSLALKRIDFAKVGDKVLFMRRGEGAAITGTVTALMPSIKSLRIKPDHQNQLIEVTTYYVLRSLAIQENERFDPLCWQLFDNIVSDYQREGIRLISADTRTYFRNVCFTDSINNIMTYFADINGATLESARSIKGNPTLTFDELYEVDKELTKTMLRHIQQNANYFNPKTGYESVLSDILFDANVFNRVNTKFSDDPDNTYEFTNICCIDNELIMYNRFKDTPKFLDTIKFNNQKIITNFTHWENSKSNGLLVEGMYHLLSILKTCLVAEKAGIKAIYYPEYDKDTSFIFINQLEALNNAI